MTGCILLWSVHMEKAKDELRQPTNEFKSSAVQSQGKLITASFIITFKGVAKGKFLVSLRAPKIKS